MILGVDPGYARCGWACVLPATARVIALGVIVTAQDKRVDKSTDRARRVAQVTQRLFEVARDRGCTQIAAEQMLGHGAAAAVAANMLPWGSLVGLAVTLGLELREISAKEWQHAAIATKRKIDYRDLAQQLATFARRQAEADFLRIDRADRTHALDAVGVGLFAAMTKNGRVIVEAA